MFIIKLYFCDVFLSGLGHNLYNKRLQVDVKIVGSVFVFSYFLDLTEARFSFH